MCPIRRWHFLDSFLVSDDLIKEADEYYKDIINRLLYYQRLFDYNGDILDLLFLPYPLFHDLIVEQTKIREEENKRTSQSADGGIPLSGKHDNRIGSEPPTFTKKRR